MTYQTTTAHVIEILTSEASNEYKSFLRKLGIFYIIAGDKKLYYKEIVEKLKKPLYLIIYKSNNAGMYEYICANALYELSGFDFEWTNSKDILEKFNNKIIEEKH